jgi:N-acetylmuramoyl-L-alanine amidase
MAGAFSTLRMPAAGRKKAASDRPGNKGFVAAFQAVNGCGSGGAGPTTTLKQRQQALLQARDLLRQERERLREERRRLQQERRQHLQQQRQQATERRQRSKQLKKFSVLKSSRLPSVMSNQTAELSDKKLLATTKKYSNRQGTPIEFAVFLFG